MFITINVQKVLSILGHFTVKSIVIGCGSLVLFRTDQINILNIASDCGSHTCDFDNWEDVHFNPAGCVGVFQTCPEILKREKLKQLGSSKQKEIKLMGP